MDFTSLQSSLLGQSPVIIAGPCSAETQEQTLATARQLNEIGIKIFRAGLWKPRTMPGAFEGVGTAGLQWLRRVKEETGMTVSRIVFNRTKFFEPSNTLMCNFTAFVTDDHELHPNEEIDSYAWFSFDEARVQIKQGSLAAEFLIAYLDQE